jgi:two-component system OmpR family response regulator
MRILLVEDDQEMRDFVTTELKEAGHDVTGSADGRDGLMLAATTDFDVLVIDRILPQLDGVGVVRGLRSMAIATPIILLTALGRVDERVQGLRAGADDYLVKPFAMMELMARIDAIKRRNVFRNDQNILQVGELSLNRLTQVANRAGHKIILKPREFRLLEQLMLNAGSVLTRTMLLESVWDYHFDPQTTLVESHICRIRAKIDRGYVNGMIQTVRGAGYRISADSVA